METLSAYQSTFKPKCILTHKKSELSSTAQRIVAPAKQSRSEAEWMSRG